MADTFSIGVDMFTALRRMLASAHVDGSKCKITIELPDETARHALVTHIKHSAPPLHFGTGSAAQAGNNAGTWLGIPYELTIPPQPEPRPICGCSRAHMERLRAGYPCGSQICPYDRAR